MSNSSEDLILPSSEELRMAAEVHLNDLQLKTGDINNSSEDLILPSSQELRIAAEAENSRCENFPTGDSNYGKNEKENDNGTESFKSPPKIHHSSMVVLKTEEEMKYRHKYFNDESEVVTNRKLRCTACCSSLQSMVLEGRDIYHHPVLKVLMCKTCIGFYGDGNFSVDEDGSDKYCRWCGQGGMLYCCSTCCCAFCKSCIKRNFNRSILTDIESEDWLCFVCNAKPLWELRAICVNAEAYSGKIRRNKREENRRNLKQLKKKQMRLKWKSQQLNHWQKNSSPDTSSDDDSYSNKKQESSRNRHKQNNGSHLDSDRGKKGDEKQKMRDSDSEPVIVDREITKRKVLCFHLSDSERSKKEEESGSVAENSTSLSDPGGNSDNEEEISDNSKKKERHQEDSKNRLKQNVKKGKCNSRVAVGTEKESKAKPEQEVGSINGGTTEDIIEKKLPEELDEKSAKLACDWLEEHGKELAIVGETLALRARRFLEKKVSLKAMTDPKNVDKVVSSLQLLMNLAEENLEHIGSFLSLHHKYWIKRVIRHRSTKTGADVSSSSQQDYEDKTKKCITEQSKDDGSMSVIGLGGDDIEPQSLTENQYDNIGFENKETGTEESDSLSADSITSTGVRRENSKKRKLLKEGSDSDDRKVMNSVEDEGNSQKSVIVDKKRRKVEDVLEMEADIFVDPDLDITVNGTESSENCKKGKEFAMKRSSEQIDMGLEDGVEEKTLKAICTDATEDVGNAEVEKFSDREKGMNVDSSENEEVSVAERSVEDMNLLHEAADRVALSETSNSGNSSTLYEVGKSERSFESLSTIKFGVHEHTLSKCVVADLQNARDKSVDSVEEVMQESQSKNSDTQNYEKSNVKSEENSADEAAIGGSSKNKENEKVSDNNSENGAAVIECLSDNARDKGISGEDYGSGENEKVNSVESLADDLMPSVKRRKVDGEVETDEDKLVTLEVPDNVEKATIDVSTEDIKELEVQNYITGKNENSVETNKMDTHEDLEKDNEKECEEKQKLESDDEGKSSDKGKLETSDNMSECEGQQKSDEKDKVEVNEGDKSSDVGELEMSDDISECEGEGKDDKKVKVEMNKDETVREDVVEEGAIAAFGYTAECIRAQQALLEYTTDDDDSGCTDTPLKKRKRRAQSRKAKQEEVAACKDINSVKKRLIGPKSRTRKYRESSSSVSSETDESECSMGRQPTNVDRGRKKKFKLKDTEAYKQDEKLRWNCTVVVERLPDEVFQKHYEQYYSDGEEESEKNVEGDNEIDSLINLKSLKKVRANNYDMDDSDAEDSSDVGTAEARKRPKKTKKKEEEQRLIDFLKQMDDTDDDSMSSGASDSEQEAIKALKIKKSLLEKENEMAMKLLLGSSTDDDNASSEKQDDLEQEEKKKNKVEEKTEETEDVSKEEEEEEEKNKETKADTDPFDACISSSDSEKSLKQKKMDWRKNKLLTERLSDLDTSDEERLWKTKKEKEQKVNDNRKKRVGRRILGSDDDSDVINTSSDHSSSGDVFIKKRKKPSKKSNSDKNTTSDSDAPREVKRKRIKAPAGDSSSSEDGQLESSQRSDATGKGRKKIHRIMKDENVGEATRRAAREEEERKKRILEKQKLYNEIYKEVEGIEKFDKLVLDFDPETKEELVSVDPYIVSKLKPHQVKGVKFMWDVCFESLKEIEKTKGSGCVLAHCMGLGKTFQVVALVHTLLKHKDTKVHTVLVVCPLSTVLNWVSEFNMWLKDIGDGEEVNVFEMSKYKKNYERMYQLKDWQSCGGVMVLGYDMFRNLTNTQTKRIRKNALETFQSTLVDPGPDLVVCDEGHMLKNEDTALAKAMRMIRTLRRIVLTGTPLQNNLKEYHCMVQFVKPNLLGTRKEFLNRFVNPISNGQFEDSTAHDVKIMKRRAHVLHKMLEGSVQRFDYSVLTPFLPPKYEYVISIRLAEVQIKAYRYYLEHYAMGKSGEKTKGAQLFNDFQNLSRIWTHPKVLQMNADKAEKIAERKHMESDSEGSLRDFIDDDDDDDDETTESSGGSSSDESDVHVMTGGAGDKSKSTRRTRSKGNVEEPEALEAGKDEEDEKSDPLPWWKQFSEGDELENMKYSGKLVLLFSILRECEKIGDKVLVFSQSLYSLDLIEYFLQCTDTATQDKETEVSVGNNSSSWYMGLDYFRLDGSTSAENRNIWCKAFNREDNHRARLFIISTRAGGLGLNLCGANRVIIFDASWNPSHDVQSIFRVYRFGQKKPCYIYRFLAQGTMEEKIYDRQVTKLSLSCRVVDEQQIERHYNMADLQELYQFNPEQKTKRPTPILPKDRLLAELLKEHEEWIVTYHEHESLLENKEEEELNEEERKAAWEEYESEKKGKIIPQVTGIPTLNMPALREIVKKENLHATEEEIEMKLKMVSNQIYEYLNSSPNGIQAPNFQYSAAQLQALQQYRIQQEQLIRAQQQEQWRLQQENALRTAANFNNTNVTFKQYLQDQKQANQNTAVYPTNLYRNIAMDKAGVLRLQSKLVPFNPPSTSFRTVNFEGNDMGGNQVISRQPVMLPLSRPSTSVMPPPPVYSSSRVNQLQEMPKQYTRRPPVGSKTAVPEDVIETID